MFRKLIIYFLAWLTFFCFIATSEATILMVDDFDSGININNLGGEAGTWSCEPEDREQFCKHQIVSYEKVGEMGFSLKLTYDITTTSNYIEDFPDIAYNGYRTKLNNLDASDYKYLSFYVKGDAQAGFTTSFWVKLKDAENASRVQVTGITGEWQEVQIPLEEFSDIQDWSNLTELTIVFDQIVTEKEGVIYLDNISFKQ